MSNDLIATRNEFNSGESGTNISRFLANRGMILVKEFREIGGMKCNYGAKLKADTVIISVAKSSMKVSQKNFGIRFESTSSQEQEDVAFLDFDEAEEFSNAITFIHEASRRIAEQKRDYTEATFSTKDDISIGFYQNTDQEQLAFIKLGRRAESLFLPVDALLNVKKLIETARAHLIKKGAGLDEM